MHESRDHVLKLLGSYSRLRILATLICHRESDLTLYMLTKYSKLSKDIVRRNVTILVNSGFVNMKFYGTIRIFSVNWKNPIINNLAEFFLKSKMV